MNSHIKISLSSVCLKLFTRVRPQFSGLLIMFYFGWVKWRPFNSSFLLLSIPMRPFHLTYTKVEQNLVPMLTHSECSVLVLHFSAWKKNKIIWSVYSFVFVPQRMSLLKALKLRKYEVNNETLLALNMRHRVCMFMSGILVMLGTCHLHVI